MHRTSQKAPMWWARGLLFENCNCQVVCPGHVHFDQTCTMERCVGYWAIVFEDGEFGDVSLAGCKAVIAYDSPPHMIDGDWTQVIIIDSDASEAQRRCIEAILTGAAGGPWAVLGRFVGKRLATCYHRIFVADEGRAKKVHIEGMLDSSIEAIRGRDKTKTVMFENMFNQIHSSTQVIARGASKYDDGDIDFETEGTHALYSNFDWSVSAA